MYPKTLPEFYESSIHLIYAVVAAQGFLIATKIFIPITHLSNHLYLNNAIAIIFAYFVLSTAWFGFFRSVKEFPHTHKKIAIPRYATGLFNSFILYYMISIASPELRTSFIDEIILVLIFVGLLLFAHILKRAEYRNYPTPVSDGETVTPAKAIRYQYASDFHLNKTIIITAFIFLIIFVIIQEHQLYYEKTRTWVVFGIHVWDPLILGVVTITIIVYRIFMWHRGNEYDLQKTKIASNN